MVNGIYSKRQQKLLKIRKQSNRRFTRVFGRVESEKCSDQHAIDSGGDRLAVRVCAGSNEAAEEIPPDPATWASTEIDDVVALENKMSLALASYRRPTL
jgi:hypothetical protein